ncbi:MAG: response regulator [Planctomycetaceae bacterium]|nr:response regulator [Planctomycetales bacterium]MCB9923649.1 response regulator [Planctomycetaceae bacterium]
MADLRILHIDDDASVTRLVAKRLTKAGYTVTSLNDPTRAMDTIINDNFRVVILDIEMPVIDGLKLLDQIKHHDGGIQVIMLTGVATTMMALESMRYGANDCLFKPIGRSNELTLAVSDAFQRIDRWRSRLGYLAERRRTERHVCRTP